MQNIKNLAIHDTPDGATLAVKVVPGSSRDKIIGVLGEELKVATRAAPERGKANQAVANILAKALHANARCIEIQSGLTSPRKTFIFHDFRAEDLRARLNDL